METYLILLRGINVGGKNKVPMSDLRRRLEELGYTNVTTYIASGNVILSSTKQPALIKDEIETLLPSAFQLDSAMIKILVLSRRQLTSIVKNKPAGFGEQPDKYHSDAIFLIGLTSAKAMHVFNPREGVDRIWPGNGAIYSQRLSAERSRSRLSAIVGTPEYAAMTIRSWTTTTKLMDLMDKAVI